MATRHVTYYGQTFPVPPVPPSPPSPTSENSTKERPTSENEKGDKKIPFQDLVEKDCGCTHLIVSSVHFGYEDDGEPYIHLNNESPDSPTFTQVWKSTETLVRERGVVATLMMGGAGGAFHRLFQNFDTFYPLLLHTLRTRPYLRGIDLDVEEEVDLDQLCQLITILDEEFGPSFLITMAPVVGALVSPEEPGMGGFTYGDLRKRKEGKRIDYFHAQCYGGSFTAQTFDAIVDAGWAPSAIVCGILSGDYPDSESWASYLETVQQIKHKHPTWGGVFVWEYSDCPPSHGVESGEWASQVSSIVNPRPAPSWCHIL